MASFAGWYYDAQRFYFFKLRLIGTSSYDLLLGGLGQYKASLLGYAMPSVNVALGRVGISNASALSLSFLNLIIPMIISLSGAVLFVLQKNKPNEVNYEKI